MTPNTTRSRISDRPRRRLARLAAAILIAGGVLALSGCDATTIDVYVETSQTLTGTDGATVSQTTYDLDESGNAVGSVTTVWQDGDADGETSTSTASYDPYGIAAPASGSYDFELDDAGQPTRITYLGDGGEVVATATFTYTEVRGHMASETYASEGLSYTTTYDPKDGWPLSGTVTVGGSTVEVEFVYEITETGAVTDQHVVVDGSAVASFTYSYEEYDGTLTVAEQGNPDGTTTSYTYELVEAPSPFAMARALVHEVDYEALLPYLGLSAQQPSAQQDSAQ